MEASLQSKNNENVEMDEELQRVISASLTSG